MSQALLRIRLTPRSHWLNETAMARHFQYLRIKRARDAVGQFLVGREGTSGAALLELAIVVPVMFLIFVTVLDFGMAFYLEMEAQHAVQAGVEYALENSGKAAVDCSSTSSDPFCQGVASAITHATASLSGDSFTPGVTGPFRGCPSSTGVVATPTAACSGTGSAGYYIRVSATYTYTPIGVVRAGSLFPSNIFSGSSNLSASAMVRVQ